ncbi:MAG: molybdopterin biosynthesis protein [Nitrososphaerota archaeon]|nr:molybdopterin biosynthesis protein [Nitrososphaerales archaeon]MDW8044159.1 molybdopterin biosynthesis protein [Nitrososphaerota archaeon]
MEKRKIFKTLMNIEEAKGKLLQYYTPKPLGVESIGLEYAHGRVLAEDVFSSIDVPNFDRAGMDGFAVRAEDTFGADEERPVELNIVGRVDTGDRPTMVVNRGEAVEVGTGAAIPKGADAVVMVEYTEQIGSKVRIFKAVTPNENIIAAGSDIMVGELVLRRGQLITSREIGVLAALGLKSVKVYRRPKVSILSTGNELTPLGEPLEYGKIYDINTYSIAGAVVECGGEPVLIGVAKDEWADIELKLREALKSGDCVITSGGTSAGLGDLLYRVIDSIGKPGVIVHGLSVKPGKPTIIGVIDGKPIFGLPGYPTSAMIIFRLIVQPIITTLSGLGEGSIEVTLEARVAQKIFSTKGRREYLPVHIVKGEMGDYYAYPVLGGSGAITTFALADGFIEIPEERAIIDEDERVTVNLITPRLKLADLVIIGSHCVGVDILLSCLRMVRPGFTAKVINVGSWGGLHAVKRGEADLAGIHLIDESSGEYNLPFIRTPDLLNKVVLIRGYRREQGLITAQGNPKKISGIGDLLREDVTFINRNPGSGTRILIDRYLKMYSEEHGMSFEEVKSKISGYNTIAKSHSAVAASIAYGKADVGVGIRAVAEYYKLHFIPLVDERYDFVTLKRKLQKESVKSFIDMLSSSIFKEELMKRAPGLIVDSETGSIIE